MFANSALARENYRKNETPMCFLHAKTSPVFRFFVGLTIIAFAFFTIVPKPLLAQEAATTTEEIINDSSDDPNDQLSIINNDSSATTTTEEIVNDGLSIINDTSSDVATTTEEMATTTEEIINDSSDDPNDQLSIINNDSSATTTTEEIINDQLSIINDSSDAATTTEEIINDQSENELIDQLSLINDPIDQLSIINDDSSDAATTTEEIINDQLSLIDNTGGSIIEIEFTNVYYGQVGAGQETIAPQITAAIVRNVSQTPAAVMLWQDDMGLGHGPDGKWNIQYGARAAGGEWVFYDPFQMVLLPDVLLPGQSAQMEFSVKVFDFPKTGAGAEIDYQGIMTINGVAAPQGEKSLPFLNEILSGDVADSDLKPESGIE